MNKTKLHYNFKLNLPSNPLNLSTKLLKHEAKKVVPTWEYHVKNYLTDSVKKVSGYI